MKKFFLLLILGMIPFMTGNAQIVGKSSDSSVEFVIKRVTDLGNGSFRLNLFITNHRKEDINSIGFLIQNFGNERKNQAYDDEGNVYNTDNWFFHSNEQKYPLIMMADFALPSEVPVKILIDIDNVDEFATVFLRLDLVLAIDQYPNPRIYVQFKNIPLPRNQ